MGFLNIVDERFLMESLADVVDKIGSFLFLGIVFGFALVIASILWAGSSLKTMIVLQQETLEEIRKLNASGLGRAGSTTRRELPPLPVQIKRERSRERTSRFTKSE